MKPISATRIEAATERLYALLPAHIRDVDATNGSALKALVEVLSSGSVEIDREIDTLYDSMFVETAPEAALAELAALVAAETLQPLPPGSSFSARAFIANTIHYRRRKGTAAVLELLTSAVSGFGAVAVEYFMRLARTQNLIDVRPERPGTAFIVPGITASHAMTGFDTTPRLVDVRSIARAGGRYHVPNVGVHLLRPVAPKFPVPSQPAPTAQQLAHVPVARPWPAGSTQHPGYFQLSAQPGRALRLFNPDRRSQDDTGRVIEPDLADRLRRLPLHFETEELRLAALQGRTPQLGETPWFDKNGQPFTIFLHTAGAPTFTRVQPAQVRIADFRALPAPAGARPGASKSYSWFTAGATAPVFSGEIPHPIACAFDPVTGRLVVAPPAAGAADVDEVRISYATGIGREIGAGPQDRNTPEMPFDITDTDDLQHLIWVVDATLTGDSGTNPRFVRKLDTALTEWAGAPVGRRGLIVLTRCDREGATTGTNVPVKVHPDSELHIVSGQWRTPLVKAGVTANPRRYGYIVRRDLRFTVDAELAVIASGASGSRPGWLVLDGLELTQGLSLRKQAFSRLLIRHCTLRAPGTTAISVTTSLEGPEIVIDRSIVGRTNLNFGTGPASGELVVRDSLISADEATGAALAADALDARLNNVTVLGSSSFKSLEATNVIFADAAKVVRTQAGCVRYSSIAPGSAMPRRFRCQPDLALTAAAERNGAPLSAVEQASVALGVKPLFLDTALDEPTVAMLHPLASNAIRMGGESETEMGVFSAAAEGLRRSNIISLFEDYVPFGLEAGLIDDTRSTAVATRGNTP